jgi:hypothetical protein
MSFVASPQEVLSAAGQPGFNPLARALGRPDERLGSAVAGLEDARAL